MNIIGIKGEKNYIIDNDSLKYSKDDFFTESKQKVKRPLLSNQITELAKSGVDNSDIAQKLNCSEAYVQKITRLLNIENGTHPQKKDKKTKILELNKQKISFDRIAQLVNCQRCYVVFVVKESENENNY